MAHALGLKLYFHPGRTPEGYHCKWTTPLQQTLARIFSVG